MARRSKAQWCELIEQQRVSGLNAAEFCRRNSVNAKYFSLQKRKLDKENGSFVRVAPPAMSSAAVATASIKIRVVELEVPVDTVADTLSLLMRA